MLPACDVVPWQEDDGKSGRGHSTRQRVPVAMLDADDSMGADSGLYGSFAPEAVVSLTGGPDLFGFGDSVGEAFLLSSGCCGILEL